MCFLREHGVVKCDRIDNSTYYCTLLLLLDKWLHERETSTMRLLSLLLFPSARVHVSFHSTPRHVSRTLCYIRVLHDRTRRRRPVPIDHCTIDCNTVYAAYVPTVVNAHRIARNRRRRFRWSTDSGASFCRCCCCSSRWCACSFHVATA